MTNKEASERFYKQMKELIKNGMDFRIKNDILKSLSPYPRDINWCFIDNKDHIIVYLYCENRTDKEAWKWHHEQIFCLGLSKTIRRKSNGYSSYFVTLGKLLPISKEYENKKHGSK